MESQIDKLLSENKAWKSQLTQEQKQKLAQNAAMHAPKVLWIGCIDSRCAPSILMNCNLNEILVVRNIAAHVDQHCMAAVEFAVGILGIENIILCAHSSCGGVITAWNQTRVQQQLPHNLQHWLSSITATAKDNYEQLACLNHDMAVQALTYKHMKNQLTLLGQQEVVQQVWKNGGNLHIQSLYADIATGDLSITPWKLTCMEDFLMLDNQPLENA